jgi:hypothetical protein
MGATKRLFRRVKPQNSIVCAWVEGAKERRGLYRNWCLKNSQQIGFCSADWRVEERLFSEFLYDAVINPMLNKALHEVLHGRAEG